MTGILSNKDVEMSELRRKEFLAATLRLLRQILIWLRLQMTLKR
jgi:hypothetical protein